MSNLHPHVNNKLFVEFLERAGDIQTIAKRLGIEVTPVFNYQSPHFLKLPESAQHSVLERLNLYKDMLEMSEREGMSNEKQLLWYAMRKLGLVPPSGFMELIDENDFIEIYVDNVQVYRSFNYYSVVSYSLDELETIPWASLFAREDALNAQLMSEVHEALTTKNIVESKTETHVVGEADSPFQNKIHYKLKYIAPLKDRESGLQNCIATVVKAHVVETTPEAQRKEKLMQWLEKKAL